MVTREEVKRKFHGILLMEGLNKRLEKSLKVAGLELWKNTQENRWMKICVDRLAKTPMVSAQVAIWRMRDAESSQQEEPPRAQAARLLVRLLARPVETAFQSLTGRTGRREERVRSQSFRTTPERSL